MTATPLFSIVTVCYNARSTISDTLESVARQVGVSLEHIVIDGGSTDGTVDYLNANSAKLAKLIVEKDSGIYDAMQKGLNFAKGKYTGFLNADDYFSGPDALKQLAELTIGRSPAGLIAATEQINSRSQVYRTIGSKPFKQSDLLWGKFPPHPSTYLNTEAMKQAGGFDRELKFVGDFDMFIRVWDLKSGPMIHSKHVLTKMRLGGISTAGYKTYFEIGKEMRHVLNKNGRRASALQLQSRCLVKIPEFISSLNTWC